MRVKGQVVCIDVLRLDLDELIVGSIEQVTNENLLFVLVINPSREKLNLFLDRLAGWDDDHTTIRVEYL